MLPAVRKTVPLDRRVLDVVAVWCANGLSERATAVYLGFIRAFIEDCRRRGVPPDDQLTRDAVIRFAGRLAQRRGCGAYFCRRTAYSALRAWSSGLAAGGTPVPSWAPRALRTPSRRILREFADYRAVRCGVATTTIRAEVDALEPFVPFVLRKRRHLRAVELRDVDSYLLELSRRYSRVTVAHVCSCIRIFFRFLHATGRIPHDIASGVIGPRLVSGERPPRALPWSSVRTILQRTDRSTRLGRRDYAVLLLMTVYGLGAAEVIGLQLDDFDWAGARLRVRRRKTRQEILLPLLPAVARAVAAYIQHARPTGPPTRALFVQMRSPHRELAGGAAVIGRVLQRRARLAGVQAPFLGSHALRHTHATRQIELGAPQKVVGDILGHRKPGSTSVYVSVALGRLRTVALPVPR